MGGEQAWEEYRESKRRTLHHLPLSPLGTFELRPGVWGQRPRLMESISQLLLRSKSRCGPRPAISPWTKASPLAGAAREGRPMMPLLV